jgi:hypothetical protein
MLRSNLPSFLLLPHTLVKSYVSAYGSSYVTISGDPKKRVEFQLCSVI